MKRRHLSGIYIFDQFPEDKNRKPTCFEDCQESTQDKWLDSLEPDALKNLAKMLGNTLINMADQFGITNVQGDDED